MSRLQQKRAGRKAPNLHDGGMTALHKNTVAATKKHGVFYGREQFLYSSIKPKGKCKRFKNRPVSILDRYDYDEAPEGMPS